jgi:signal transduction histidine kinase
MEADGVSEREREVEERVHALEERVAALEARNLELERMAAARGVKLSCANIALSRAKIAFDEAAKRREEMVHDVSHDLRTPLTSIKGAAQNLLDGIAGPVDGSIREYVEIMRDHAERLIAIVNWLVQAISVSADPVELHTGEVDLEVLAEDVVRGLLPIARERGVTLSAETKPARAIADDRRLRQVLENLVGNALKFTREGGSVTLLVCSEAERVCIRVTDTGIGMSAEEANRVFERYYRKGSGGAGLGLAICREVVRLHGGEITVRSTVGVGSEFIVALPSAMPPLIPDES